MELGMIQHVDLRERWPRDRVDFNTWLAENISYLGEALGLDLEVRDLESPVGGYSLNVLAEDVGNYRIVIIENQLEPTDHGHLGKLLTYSSGHNAGVVVSLTRQFREETARPWIGSINARVKTPISLGRLWSC